MADAAPSSDATLSSGKLKSAAAAAAAAAAEFFEESSNLEQDVVLVTVVNLSGTTVALVRLQHHESILDLKTAVMHHGGPWIYLQNLVCGEKELVDSETCQTLGWMLGAEIVVTLLQQRLEAETSIANFLKLGEGPLVHRTLPDHAALVHFLAVAEECFSSEPMLLQLEPPLVICGDIRGSNTFQIPRIFDLCGEPPTSRYLFLGGYVPAWLQGEPAGIETFLLLLLYKIRHPINMFLLRSNHESYRMTRVYGFYDECKRRFNIKTWKLFCRVFNRMPICALIHEKIFCAHGGLSPHLVDFEQINSLPRGEIPDHGLMCDLVWSDYSECTTGWEESDRGVSFQFGDDVISDFVDKHKLELVCCGHQVKDDGYQLSSNRKLVTIWSSTHFKGEFTNKAAAMLVDANLQTSFVVWDE